MRHFLALLFIASCSQLVKGQIPNPSFEDSAFVKYPSKLNSWSTPNEYSYDHGSVDATLDVSNDTDGSNPVNLVSDPNSFDWNAARGFRINGRPDSLIVWMTYSLSPGDTLFVRTKNRETGNPFGYGEGQFTFPGPFSVERYAIKIDYPSPGFADSGLIQFFVKQANSGTWHDIEIQKVQLVNFIGQPLNVTPNNNFNDWEQDSMIQPKGWGTYSYFSQVIGFPFATPIETFTTDASSGSFAIKMTNQSVGGGAEVGAIIPLEGLAAVNYEGDLFNPEPMIPVDKKYVSLLGDYKLLNAGGDSARVGFAMFSNGSLVANKVLNLPQSGSSYSNFEVHLDYDTFSGTPDSAAILITSGTDNAVGGAEFFIDNLRLSETSSLKRIEQPLLRIYPNPNNGVLQVAPINGQKGLLSIINLQGQLLASHYIDGNEQTILLPKVPAGVYIIRYTSNESTQNQKIIIE